MGRSLLHNGRMGPTSPIIKPSLHHHLIHPLTPTLNHEKHEYPQALKHSELHLKNCVNVSGTQRDRPRIQMPRAKLKDYAFDDDIFGIIEANRSQSYALVIVKIQSFISLNQQLSIWLYPEVAALKLELKTLEIQFSAFDNEKVELEKLLSAFQRRHTVELEETVLKVKSEKRKVRHHIRILAY